MVCGEEESAARALDAIESLKPDLVIADISLKDSSGLELMRNIKAQHPGTACSGCQCSRRVYLCGNRLPRRGARII